MTKKSRNLAVLDTNVIFSGLTREHGTTFEILEKGRAGAFEMVISGAVVSEYRSVLSRPSFISRYDAAIDAKNAFLSGLLENAFVSTPPMESPVVCRDPKDTKFLLAALGALNSFLVTGDDDLLSLAGDPRLGNLRIVRPRAFLDLLISDD